LSFCLLAQGGQSQNAGNRTAQDVVVSLCELGEIPRRQAAQKVVWSRARTVKHEQERLPGEAGVTQGGGGVVEEGQGGGDKVGRPVGSSRSRTPFQRGSPPNI
jgi:hypothetical protein